MGESSASPSVIRARELLRRLAERSGGNHVDDHDVTESAIALAGLLVTEANRTRTRAEDVRMAQLARLMHDPAGQVFTTLLTDRAARSQDARRVTSELDHLLRACGAPGYMTPTERGLLRLAQIARHLVPTQVHAGLISRLHDQTRAVILPAEDPALSEHLAAQRRIGVHVNVNHLGEAVLSEPEATARVNHYCALLARSDVDTISVKLSSICSQLHPLGVEQTLERAVPRLQAIYRAALVPGASRSKLVVLDMESYRDLHLTVAAFQRALSTPALDSLTAGIVLQAYLPDSHALQRELTTWATARYDQGGAPIRIRIVKGANLAHEAAESSLRGWPMPTFLSKTETDASFKRMVAYACEADHTRAVLVGVASHNAFDLAYAAALAFARGVQADVGFELLQGMAEPLLRALYAVTGNVLAYTPVVEAHEIQNGIAYLIRRLDENTAPENFLRQSFALRPNTPEWLTQEQRFLESLAAQRGLSESPQRTQDQRSPALPPRDCGFQNEPDTDFGLAHNRQWLLSLLDHAREQAAPDIASAIAGEDIFTGEVRHGVDPSRPDHVAYRYALADEAALERAISTASAATQAWSSTSFEARDQLLHACATELRRDRGVLIAAMVLDAGKAPLEADAEVSEAIDFAEYYRRSARALYEHSDVTCTPKGVVLVTPPWNFPLAIPAGGALAALVTGNTVILKPAMETVLVARRLCEALWRAGVPRDVLQLVLCDDSLGSRLIQDSRIHTVILTGATDTARLFRRLRPGLDLLAETGGKNAIVVSAMSDWDLAIKDTLQSAFGHAGQKCSAASLLICEAEVYDSPSFRTRLRDAALSLAVGSAWQPDTVLTPLIHPPQGNLLRGLSRLDDGEAWLVEPKQDPSNPRLWSPGIRIGVRAGSFCHQTELFGPVLSVMRADNLDHAITLANGTAYGLTSGLFALNENEQQRWIDQIDAGNLYINRGTTGAIVRRQPFGGTKASSFGPGAKAGGPGYVAQLVTRTSERAHDDYRSAWRDHFSRRSDVSHVLGQDNLFDHVPCAGVCVLVTERAVAADLQLVIDALQVCRMSVEIATVDASPACLDVVRGAHHHMHTQHAPPRLLSHLRARGFRRIRVVGTLPEALSNVLTEIDAHIERSPVSKCGDVELRHYLRERSLSHTYHRYGNLSRLPNLKGTPRA